MTALCVEWFLRQHSVKKNFDLAGGICAEMWGTVSVGAIIDIGILML